MLISLPVLAAPPTEAELFLGSRYLSRVDQCDRVEKGYSTRVEQGTIPPGTAAGHQQPTPSLQG